jgi:hypothetical protein
MKLPNDIRYANQIWMMTVLISPLIPILIGSPLIIFNAFGVFLEVYAFHVMVSGILLILYWALLLVIILSVNSANQSKLYKKVIIQILTALIIVVYFAFFPPYQNHPLGWTSLMYPLSYLMTSSFAIWYFQFDNGYVREEVDVIDHLVD